MMLRILIPAVIILIITSGGSVKAQVFDKIEKVQIDTNYIQAYKDELTVRTYISRKQNRYFLASKLASPYLKYHTNDNLLLGLGYTYSFLTLNLGIKMPFINGDDDIYGESRYFDLQAHTILRSYIIDFYLQWNKGYYLSNPEDLIPGWDPDGPFPMRGDMRTHILGLNVQYLFNSERFSYKASFLQNEFQKKSAGSPILGLEAYWMLGMTDSLMIGGNIPKSGFLENQDFNQVDIANAGVNGGYTYTFVWDEKLYLSLSTVLGFSAGYNQIHYTDSSTTITSKMTVGYCNTSRVSLGYNSKRYFVGLSYSHFLMSNRAPGYGDWYTYGTGYIRLSVVRRFILKRPIIILRPDLWIRH
jgi:hypothetical protein